MARKALGFSLEPLPPLQEPEPIVSGSSGELEARRESNRKRLVELVAQVYFYGASFYVLFAAIYLPLSFKNFGTPKSLDFLSTRLPLDLTLASHNFSTVALVAAFTLYIPCWLLSIKVASLVARIWHNYQEVTPLRFGLFITLSMFLFGFLICGNWIYILYPQNSYVMSVLLPFVIILLAAGFASSRK